MMQKRNKLSQRGQAIFDLTLDLVKIPSISGTGGEICVAEEIFNTLSQWPYFQNNPDFLQKVPVRDKINSDRFNVIAFVKGSQESSAKTLLYLGHFDTVDTSEYKELEHLACEPETLEFALAKHDLPADVRNDIDSDEWLFGRGTADMKSGLAILIHLLKEFAENSHQQTGNIVFAAVADEEADSQGMLSAAQDLVSLATKEKLQWVGAINTDVVTQIDSAAPDNRYMYFGSMGKIVPAVYAIGKAAHVGESLKGFDVNDLLSRLTWLIDNNMALADHFEDKVTYPPISLKQTDLKELYCGMVPYEGFAYYNFLNYQRGPQEILKIMQSLVETGFKDCIAKLRKASQQYAALSDNPGFTLDCLPTEPDVLMYAELYSEVCSKSSQAEVEQILTATIDSLLTKTNADLRDCSLARVRTLWKLSGRKGPAAVLFIAPPYYPPQPHLIEKSQYLTFNAIVKNTVNNVAASLGCNVTLEPFFPYLSDACFLAYHESSNNQDTLEANMPCWGKGWEIDIDNVRKLQLPVIDMGVHGKDFHKIYERVHIPYTMDQLPEFIWQTTQALLMKETKVD